LEALSDSLHRTAWQARASPADAILASAVRSVWRTESRYSHRQIFAPGRGSPKGRSSARRRFRHGCTKELVVCQDVTNDARYLTAFATTGSEAICPVLSEVGAVIGTIDVESDRQNAFSADDERFLRACADTLRKLWESAPHQKT